MDKSRLNLLIVEGTDEKHVVEKLVKRHNLNQSFDIEPKDGYTNLRDSIYNEVNVSGRQALGIVADANESLQNRWQSIRCKLKEVQSNIPTSLSRGGCVFTGPRNLRIGVWLMPDNSHAGELEDFVAEMIPEEDSIWPLSKSFIDGIPNSERPFQSKKITRAYVHAWLATRKEPRPMGTGITAGDFRHDTEVALRFVSWLKKLFS